MADITLTGNVTLTDGDGGSVTISMEGQGSSARAALKSAFRDYHGSPWDRLRGVDPCGAIDVALLERRNEPLHREYGR